MKEGSGGASARGPRRGLRPWGRGPRGGGGTARASRPTQAQAQAQAHLGRFGAALTPPPAPVSWTASSQRAGSSEDPGNYMCKLPSPSSSSQQMPPKGLLFLAWTALPGWDPQSCRPLQQEEASWLKVRAGGWMPKTLGPPCPFLPLAPGAPSANRRPDSGSTTVAAPGELGHSHTSEDRRDLPCSLCTLPPGRGTKTWSKQLRAGTPHLSRGATRAPWLKREL